ncbi:hypothetical protein CsSME_00046112 [Camellia sinensis var. sinensis]
MMQEGIMALVQIVVTCTSRNFMGYLTLLEKHPVLTKAVTSAFLTFIGDLICQTLVRNQLLDIGRTL